jgi:hypothetical protein
VLARVGLVFVDDLAAVDLVFEHRVKRATAERLAAPAAARCADPALTGDAVGLEFLLQQSHRAERHIAPEDIANRLGLALDDDQLSVADRVAERRHPAHPHPLLFRGGDLVADVPATGL